MLATANAERALRMSGRTERQKPSTSKKSTSKSDLEQQGIERSSVNVDSSPDNCEKIEPSAQRARSDSSSREAPRDENIKRRGRVNINTDSIDNASKRLREILAGIPVIVGEHEEDYQLLYNELLKELRPANVIEEIYVNEIIYHVWETIRLRRVLHVRMAVLTASCPDEPPKTNRKQAQRASSAPVKLKGSRIEFERQKADSLAAHIDHLSQYDKWIADHEKRMNKSFELLREIQTSRRLRDREVTDLEVASDRR